MDLAGCIEVLSDSFFTTAECYISLDQKYKRRLRRGIHNVTPHALPAIWWLKASIATRL